jgi:hypothetical protein
MHFPIRLFELRVRVPQRALETEGSGSSASDGRVENLAHLEGERAIATELARHVRLWWILGPELKRARCVSASQQQPAAHIEFL